MTSQTYLKENIFKNILVVALALFLYPVFSEAVDTIRVEQMNDFLLTVSIFLVTVSFACFGFTYEKSRLQTVGGKLVSHGATFLCMLIIAFLLEIMILAIRVVYPSFYGIFAWIGILLYLVIVLYDFWDIDRAS